MQRRIERPPRPQHTVRDMDQLTHHGTQDQHRRLAGGGQAAFQPRVGWAKRSVPTRTITQNRSDPCPATDAVSQPVGHSSSPRPWPTAAADCWWNTSNGYDMPGALLNPAILSRPSPCASCRTTCTPSGACRMAMRISVGAGAPSNAFFRAAFVPRPRAPRAKLPNVKRASGNGVFGNTRFWMTPTSNGTWITCTSIRSSTAWLGE